MKRFNTIEISNDKKELSFTDAKRVFNMIKEGLENGQGVKVLLSEFSDGGGSFLNSVICPLYEIFPEETIEENVFVYGLGVPDIRRSLRNFLLEDVVNAFKSRFKGESKWNIQL